jgi:CelD/BcsL family acetyltransferase involved in cellulose biosynthesis
MLITGMSLNGRSDPAALAVRGLTAGEADDWDDLVRRSCNGTFLHTRRFLSYHRGRFADRSLLLHDRRGKVRGVLPAAVSPADPETIVSHPGLTYGALVHDGSVRGAAMVAALGEIAGHYRRLGYRRLRYKAVPAIYHSEPADDDLYALFRLGARCDRSDLSATIDLTRRGRVSQRRIRSRKAAGAASVTTSDSWDDIGEFWAILEANLAQRHAASPVHSAGDIQLLHSLFPDDIVLITARAGQALAGGTVLFATGPVLHMQYTATTSEGRAACATDVVMERAIELARGGGYRYFDFGISTQSAGRILDENLYQFKVSFGAGGVTYDHYEVDLRDPAPSAATAEATDGRQTP